VLGREQAKGLKLHTEEHNLYTPSSIIRMIMSRIMRWVEHVAHMGRKRMHIGFCWKCKKGRFHWEHPDVGGRIILRWVLQSKGWY
jgi:hypothetical protein